MKIIMKKFILVYMIMVLIVGILSVVSCDDSTDDSSRNLEIEEVSIPDHPLTKGQKDENGIFHGYSFADKIIEYTGKEDKRFRKKLALNGVRGRGSGSGSLDVFVIGDGTDKYATFEWAGKAIINGEGNDFKVFENGFVINGTDLMSMDLGTVEVSVDGTEWKKMPVTYSDKPEVRSTEGKSGLLGLRPVYLNFDRQVSIDPASEEAGGDGFDLSDAGIPDNGIVKYVRIRDGGNDYPDGQVGSNGIDIDGICALHWKELSE